MNMSASLCPHHRYRLGSSLARRAAHVVMAARAATWVVLGCYKREANGGAEEALGPPLAPEGESVEVHGCPLTSRPTQGGIGAAHGARDQFGGSTGVSHNPSGDTWWYWGVPPSPGTTQREYWGIP